MGRKGELSIGVIVAIALAVLIIGLMVFFYQDIFGFFKQTVACDEEDAQYTCQLSSVGCGDERRVWHKRCEDADDKSRICCVERGKPGGGGTGEDEPKEPEFTLSVYQIDAEAPFDEEGNFVEQEIRNLDSMASLSSVNTVVGIPKMIMVEVEAEHCDDVCLNEARWRFTATNEAGEEVLLLVADRIVVDGKEEITQFIELENDEQLDPTKEENKFLRLLADTEDKEKIKFDRSFSFVFPDIFLDERVTFTAEVQYVKEIEPQEELEPNEEGPPKPAVTKEYSDEITIFFPIKPAVRIGGLTNQWEQSKTIQVVCENPVRCGNTYFSIIRDTKDPLVCPTLTLEKAQAAPPIKEEFCVVDKDGKQHSCWNTDQSCKEQGLAAFLSEDSSPALAALKQAIIDNFVDEDDTETLEKIKKIEDAMEIWQPLENLESAPRCQRSLPVEDGNDLGFDTWYKITRPVETEERWQFTLDMPYMAGQYLCTSGQSLHVEDTFYTAGDPKKIHVDRLPPNGTIVFKPGTLALTFTCDDAHSGCENYYGQAYVADMGGYFTSIFRGSAERAEKWCPEYDTGAYYQPTGDFTYYRDVAVRVLCVRVVDRAGNAAVSMTTVYNGYDILAAVLHEFISDDEEQVEVPQ